MDQELERFKLDINLSEFAAFHGYGLNKRYSWRGGAVMEKDGDKIIIARDASDNHWIYYSVRDDRDCGSIIDFLQNRNGGNLGRIRATLRNWIGSFPARPDPKLYAHEVIATEKDRGQVMVEYARMEDAGAHPYLVHERKIPAVVLTSKRFAGQIRIDARGNAVFPHVDKSGLCGFEVKNRNWTGFAKGGLKGLWFSKTFTGDKTLVICEAAIDAISYHALKPEKHTRYASIGGQVNPQQPELIAAAVSRMPEGSEIVAAMDNNEAGWKLAALVEDVVKGSGRIYRLDLPAGEGMDWNDVLRASLPCPADPTSSFPAARFEIE